MTLNHSTDARAKEKRAGRGWASEAMLAFVRALARADAGFGVFDERLPIPNHCVSGCRPLSPSNQGEAVEKVPSPAVEWDFLCLRVCVPMLCICIVPGSLAPHEA